MRLVFLGPPGAGKGTQAARLAAHLGVPHVATGEMLRRAVAAGNELGKKVEEIMERGDLVSDDLMKDVVAHRLADEDARDGFVLDGYPRNHAQAAELDRILEEQGAKLDRVVRFMVTGDEIVARLAGRLSCPTCGTVYHAATRPPKVEGVCDKDATPLVHRKDDNEEAVLRRLDEYGRQTKSLADLYEERGLLVEVDAIGSGDEVFNRILEEVGT
jgi:adenylate kinase